MKLLTIPKFIFRILRYITMEFWRVWILLIVGLITMTPPINLMLAKRHGFYKSIEGFIRLDLWKLSKGGL